MIIDIGEIKAQTLGDPHMGKVFKNGVPLERRGEREAEQRQRFIKEITEVAADVHICMGDLFDKFIVPPEVVLDVADQYRKAAARNPEVTYYVLRGNHDAARDADRRSSFDIFKALVADIENVTVMDEEARSYHCGENERFLLCPWHPFKNAQEILDEAEGEQFAAIFGHWDVQSFGGNDDNLLPPNVWERTGLVVTGHVHLPEIRELSGDNRLVITGSMQPYSHAEDAYGDYYLTLSLEELQALPDLASLRDKAVRLLLKPGEEVPGEIDCLQFSTKVVSEGSDPDETTEVKIEDFNFKELFFQVMSEEQVSDGVSNKVWGYFEESRGDTTVQ